MTGHDFEIRELGITAITRLASGRVVTRFNSDLISERRCTWCIPWVTHLLSASLFRSRSSTIGLRVIFFTFLPGLSSSPAKRFLSVRLRWTPPHWRHALPPTLSSHAEGECTHALTRTRADRRASATRASRVHRR